LLVTTTIGNLNTQLHILKNAIRDKLVVEVADYNFSGRTMDTTPNLNLPYLAAAQSQKHVTHNEAIRALDALVQIAVVSRVLTLPPSNPADGQRYIVAPSATGAWSGQTAKIAAYQDGAWAFYAPQPGWLAWVAAEHTHVAWDGTAWVTIGGSVNPTALVGINTTADTTNRLAVKSPASLFDNAGNGHQIKVNKAASADTASVLIQTAYSGRAEIGLSGDDNLHVKVSPDGTAWADALVIDRTTAAITHAPGARHTFQHASASAGLQLKPAAGDPTNPVDGDLWYNATTSSFRVRQNGVTSGLSGGGAQVQADWNATSGPGAIANKPTLGSAAFRAANEFDIVGAAAAAMTVANAKQSPATTLAGYGITDALSATAPIARNLVLAGPATGANGAPAFRALTTADLPAGTVIATSLDLATYTLSADQPVNATSGPAGASQVGLFVKVKLDTARNASPNFTVANNRYTASKIVKIDISAMAAILMGGNAASASLVVFKNGSLFGSLATLYFAANNAQSISLPMTPTTLQANDYLELFMYSTQPYTVQGGSFSSVFSVKETL
jgi:Protein of unknown function (DUF2793)